VGQFKSSLDWYKVLEDKVLPGVLPGEIVLVGQAVAEAGDQGDMPSHLCVVLLFVRGSPRPLGPILDWVPTEHSSWLFVPVVAPLSEDAGWAGCRSALVDRVDEFRVLTNRRLLTKYEKGAVGTVLHEVERCLKA